MAISRLPKVGGFLLGSYVVISWRKVELGPLLGAKRTLDVRFLSPKRSWADDVRLRG